MSGGITSAPTPTETPVYRPTSDLDQDDLSDTAGSLPTLRGIYETLFTKDGWLGDYDYGFLCMPTLPCLNRNSSRKPPFFGLKTKLPVLLAIVMGFQHALAMLAGVVTPVLIMSGPGTGNMNLDVSTRSYMLSASLISSGILSLIQITRFRIFNTKYYLGTGLLSVLQCAWMEQKAEHSPGAVPSWIASGSSRAMVTGQQVFLHWHSYSNSSNLSMGHTLSTPITEKHSSTGHNARLAFAASAMQGWRTTMEDAHTTLLDVEDATGTAFFAVYDGHGGRKVAEYCGEHLHRNIVADPAFNNEDFKSAITNGFLETDNAIRNDPNCEGNTSGCTAITATITDKNILYVGNAGDSRAVLGRNGMTIDLSVDHKPTNSDEYIRIVSAGGSVESGRINCGIGLSRALGDFGLKSNSLIELEEQILIANPDVKEHRLTDEDEFLVLACDGIWDCMTSKQVIKVVRQEIADGTPLDKICEKIMDSCLATEVKPSFIGFDNMTMIIVAFLNGRTIQEWQEHIRQRVSTHVKPTNPPNGSSNVDIGGTTPDSGKRTSRFYSRLPRWLHGRSTT